MMPIPSPPPPPSSSPPPPTSAKRTAIMTNNNTTTWGPYAGGRDFKGNALVILSVVFCVILLFLAFNSIIRFVLCSSSHHDNPNSTSSTSHDEEDPDQGKNRKNATDTGRADPQVVAFSKEMELAGAAAECAICLCEFEEGEGIRVLPACSHGFHVTCVERWLAVRCSCPTCRCSTINATGFAVKVSDDD